MGISLVEASTGRGAEPLAGVIACRALPDDSARLACFDRETAALAAKTAAPVAVAPAPAAALDPRQQFGLPDQAIAKQEVAAGTRAAAAEKIEAHITNLSQTANGRGIFTLDNDQVWRQLVSDGDVLAKVGDTVTISRGVFGSYWLLTKQKRGTKVTRVR